MPQVVRTFRDKLAGHIYTKTMLPFDFALGWDQLAPIVKKRYFQEADEIIQIFKDHMKEMAKD
jgi:hypothetical protein